MASTQEGGFNLGEAALRRPFTAAAIAAMRSRTTGSQIPALPGGQVDK